MQLLSAAESRELDRLSREKYGIPSYALMTRAGEAVAREVALRFPVNGETLIVAGKGNNGGDGMVAARRLIEQGARSRVVLLARGDDLKGDARRAHQELLTKRGSITEVLAESDVAAAFGAPAVVIDAIFGTGLNAEVAGLMRCAIERMNSLKVPVAAVDIASGVNADTGAVMGAAVNAAMTVTFGRAKYGHVSYPGADLCGDLRIVEIGFAPQALSGLNATGRLIERADAAALLKPRPLNAHKGMYGHPMVIAASLGKSGAALLAARGALRAGAGLVTAAVPASVQPLVAAGQAELMTEPIPDHDGHFDADRAPHRLAQLIDGKDALVFGPGIGLNDDTKALLAWLINEGARAGQPMLIDADGLNAAAALGCEMLRRARGPVVLTPHPGEMGRLLGVTGAAVNADRITAARTLAERTRAHVLLKGAHSVIASPDGQIQINSSGNPGMATPGMGDVLSGIVGAFLAQRLSPADALALGVFIHGYAADRAAARLGPVGYIAGDLTDELPGALAALASSRHTD